MVSSHPCGARNEGLSLPPLALGPASVWGRMTANGRDGAREAFSRPSGGASFPDRYDGVSLTQRCYIIIA